ncbi:hypothetical protein [Bradyrhizobium sp.]|uniref:hypothetical protein n=1 Tax=Bradyrhizobium sp. TaxID=376 RepID=UPI001D8AB3F6|nr:hypothetical protein [Bradyrhizobium sp.]MBI5323212.1 hypothetical protein [Bradyrhizobium sp.]
MSKVVKALALVLSVFLLTSPTLAQDATDRALLATFCDAANIKGDTCTRAKGYPASGRKNGCDVKLLKDRFSGRFIASGNPLLVVNYDSGCEARANDDGGSAVFELAGGKYGFVGFQPGARVNDCIVVPRSEKQDSLVCLAGHMGQGYLEGGVAQMAFARDYGKGIGIKHDFLLRATDSTGAHGANVVTCRKKPPAFFELSKLAAGPRKETVAFDASYADADIFRTACGKGFPKPKETFGTLAKGDAYVPPGFENKGRVMIDLATRKVLPPN